VISDKEKLNLNDSWIFNSSFVISISSRSSLTQTRSDLPLLINRSKSNEKSEFTAYWVQCESRFARATPWSSLRSPLARRSQPIFLCPSCILTHRSVLQACFESLLWLVSLDWPFLEPDWSRFAIVQLSWKSCLVARFALGQPTRQSCQSGLSVQCHIADHSLRGLSLSSPGPRSTRNFPHRWL